VETKPATTAVDTKPDAHAAFENEVKRANSISDRFDRAEALDRLQEDEHGLFSGVPNDEKEAVLQRHRRN
jgi:Asp-tRNA(Asn)/Glu-tRNA(Gln) amidotransferase C subunit